MMSSTFGAPLGAATCGGHHGFDCAWVCLISPPNFGGAGGRAFDFSGSLYAGEPGFAPPSCPPTVIGTKNPASTAAATPTPSADRMILLFMIASLPASHASPSAAGAAHRPASASADRARA